jgi:hypothetical protein
MDNEALLKILKKPGCLCSLWQSIFDNFKNYVEGL